MSEQISTIQTSEVLELMRNLAPILNKKELFEFMLFSNRVLKRYMPEHYSDGLSEEVTEMRKDKEWLKEEVWKQDTVMSKGYIYTDDLMSIINELDEPEQTDTNVGLSKPIIPKFVAEWIDAHNLYGNNPLREYRDLEIDFNEGWTDEKDAAVYHWVNKNPYAFIDALRYGCEVEEEKNYRVVFPYKGEMVYLREGVHGDFDVIETETYGTQYTEAEIKAIDERYWAFAQEVTE